MSGTRPVELSCDGIEYCCHCCSKELLRAEEGQIFGVVLQCRDCGVRNLCNGCIDAWKWCCLFGAAGRFLMAGRYDAIEQRSDVGTRENGETVTFAVRYDALKSQVPIHCPVVHDREDG